MFRKAKSLGKSLLIASGAIVFSVGIYAVTAEFIGPGLKGSTDADRPLGTAINLLVGTNADQIELANDCSSSTAEICLDADDNYDMDSSNVVANASGSVIERLEWIMANKVDDKNCQAGNVDDGTTDFDGDQVVYNIDYTLTGITQTGSYINVLTNGQETYTASLSCSQKVVSVSNENVTISCESGFHESGGDCVEDITVVDVFSTDLYTGNGSIQTINNGIDLVNKGGLVWIKSRSNGVWSHWLRDTIRGDSWLHSDSADNAIPLAGQDLPSINNDGFTLPIWTQLDAVSEDYVSWTFREAPRFFDVVTYTGDNDMTGREIAHDLGVVPGMIIVKSTSNAENWFVYHRSTGATGYLMLNDTGSFKTQQWAWFDTEPTDTHFTVGQIGEINQNGFEYVAYLFAHDPSADGMIQCGDFTTDGSGHAEVNLGWEPQWLIEKQFNEAGDAWRIVDSMRGFTADWVNDQVLEANASSAEYGANNFYPLSNWFALNLQANDNYIYCAIRKPFDYTPDTFNFADQQGVALDTLIESNIAQIMGIDAPTAVSVSGEGNPQFRICSDSSCNTEIQTWGNTAQDIENNQYLQLRLTSGATVNSTQVVEITVGETSDTWRVSDVAPTAVDFDGTNDYLSRSSDLVENSDGKIFTFSAWVYVDGSTLLPILSFDGDPGEAGLFRINAASNPANLNIEMTRVGGGAEAFSYALNNAIPHHTWTNILVSIDLESTNHRHVYINDVDVTDSGTFDNYFDTNIIDFTVPHWYVGTQEGLPEYRGRLANIYLDHTYRDLSIEANRRLFTSIDSERGLIPADNQADLNPILYLPLASADTAGQNLGTGGDFTVNGTLSTSTRGPNQYNASASYFDSGTDLLTSQTMPTGQQTEITISGTINLDAADQQYIFTGGHYYTRIHSALYLESNRDLILNLRTTWNATPMELNVGTVPVGKNVSFAVSVDLVNNIQHSVINGVVTTTNFDYSNDYYLFADPGNPYGAIGWVYAWTAYECNGSIGNFYLDTSYIDLAANNPFWNVEEDKPAYLGQAGELPTGSAPLMYLPLRADDAGKNLGTGGDFTVNGTLEGARGPSEDWVSSADFDGSTGYLSRDGLNGVNDSKTFALAFSLISQNQSNTYVLDTNHSVNGKNNFKIEIAPGTGLDKALKIDAFDVNGDRCLRGTTGGNTIIYNTWLNVLMAWNGDTKDFKLYINNDSEPISIDTNIWNAIALGAVDKWHVASESDNSSYLDANVGNFYFTTDYIDFSQESNRLKFVDGLGNPRNLETAIANGDIPEPLIYMPFDEADNLGKNLGTGGDFTVNGTVTQGGDVRTFY